MRYAVGFVLFLLALGTVRVVGCGGDGDQPQHDCASADDCDDENTCTDDYCRYEGAPVRVCVHELVERGATNQYGIVECSLDGGLGYCVNGICEEDFCDDGDVCIYEAPFFQGGCRPFGAPPNGTPCELGGVAGVCISGACEEGNPCEGVVCDDGNLCTTDKCDYLYNPGSCIFPPVDCTADGFPHAWYNDCQRDVCVPKTGECDYTLADDRSCCLEWSPNCGFCIPACPCCMDSGTCQDGECI